NPPVLHGGAGDNRMTKQSDHQIGLRRCPARIGRVGWLAVATQVIENPRNHCRFLDTGDHPQLPAIAPTDLDVDRERQRAALLVQAASGGSMDRSGHPAPGRSSALAALTITSMS